MVKETEIKLRVSRTTLAALREHPLLKKRNKSGWTRHELFNQYFDTPARDLAQAKVALRIRRDGDAIIQTLKTRGHSVAGLSERNEYDWPLSKAKLDTKKLSAECWPASLAELDKKQLQAIFSTDFVREKADIAWGRGKARVVIEAALDLGKVVAGKLEEEICELELELREGEAAALLELAAELAADLALIPCDIGKAGVGDRLFDDKKEKSATVLSSSRISPVSILKMLGTFHIVCITLLLFRAENISQAWEMFSRFATDWSWSPLAEFSLAMIAVLAGPLMIYEAWAEKRVRLLALTECHWLPRAGVYIIIILTIVYFAPERSSEFIYFQF